jgi:hypothetical protein
MSACFPSTVAAVFHVLDEDKLLIRLYINRLMFTSFYSDIFHRDVFAGIPKMDLSDKRKLSPKAVPRSEYFALEMVVF